MTADYEWNACLLTPADAGPPVLVAMNTSGGRTLTGREQIVGNSIGYWRMDYFGIAVNTPEQVREWNALQAGTQGRAKTILVPVLDDLRAPLITDAAIDVDADARAVVVVIRVGGVFDLLPGMHFTVGERLHRITKINSSAASSSGSENWNVSITPPLRERLAKGQVVQFQDLKFRCRLASDDAMAGLSLSMWKFGNGPSVSFLEDV